MLYNVIDLKNQGHKNYSFKIIFNKAAYLIIFT